MFSIADLPERMQSKVVIDGDCWTWTGARNGKGYGSVSNGKNGSLLAHRLVFTELVGPIEDGLTVDHLCANKLCLNVFHMELVTRGENSRRKNERQTHCKSGHPLSGDNLRLTPRKTGRVHRVCRECARAQNVAYRRRVKEAVAS